MIEFVKAVPGGNLLKPGLHPRTGYMIIVPSFAMLCLFILYLVSPNLQRADNVLTGFGLMIAILGGAVIYGRWEDRGEAVAWDEDAIYVRQNHPDWGRWRTRGFARIPYEVIDSIEAGPMPRGVPPQYPVLQIVLRDNSRLPNANIRIDPNYFRIRHLLSFVSELRARAPQIDDGPRAKRLDKVLAGIHRNRMPWD